MYHGEHSTLGEVDPLTNHHTCHHSCNRNAASELIIVRLQRFGGFCSKNKENPVKNFKKNIIKLELLNRNTSDGGKEWMQGNYLQNNFSKSH